jgi:hypothetical protein
MDLFIETKAEVFSNSFKFIEHVKPGAVDSIALISKTRLRGAILLIFFPLIRAPTNSEACPLLGKFAIHVASWQGGTMERMLKGPIFFLHGSTSQECSVLFHPHIHAMVDMEMIIYIEGIVLITTLGYFFPGHQNGAIDVKPPIPWASAPVSRRRDLCVRYFLLSLSKR